MSPEAVVAIVSASLGIVARVAPGVLAAITGSRTDEEAIDAALDVVQRLPIRHGSEGADARDLAERERG